MSSKKLIGFVVTPLGIIMHAENHRKMVESLGKSSLLTMLVPAVPMKPFDDKP